jgi:hypothetical protein
MKAALDKVKAKSLEPTVEKPSEILPVDEDMEELLMLASGTLTHSNGASAAVQFKEPRIALKSAELAGLIEEKQVLVSGPTQANPTHNLNYFNAPMLEVLNPFGIQKPRLIQAHIWEPILNFFDVAFVSGSKTGKTLGIFLFIF